MLLTDLRPDAHNRRKHTTRNLAMLGAALREVGAARSIVIDEEGEVLAGNGVLEAAQAAGLSRVQVVDADGETIIAVRRSGLTGEQKRALAIYDNRVAELAEWDWSQLKKDHTAGLPLDPWWAPDELSADLPKGYREADVDVVPVVARPTDIERGDLFALGAHRLLCGDSTDPAQVSRVLGGELAQLVFTDPPYGVAYDGGDVGNKHPQLAGDGSIALYGPACTMAMAMSDAAAPLYLWHGNSGVQTAVLAAGYVVRSQLMWNKNTAQGGALSAHYKQKHEACFYCVKKGKTPRWYGPNTETTVWDVDRASRNEFHPTQKPVALAERALSNSSLPGDRVLDLFLGSGSTLIACETLGRRGAGLELEPGYCQVILDRWESLTGQRAERLARAGE